MALCGLYCGLCASRRRIPSRAAALRAALRQEGYDRGYFDDPELERVFAALWQGLNRLADRPCPGCRAGGGYPNCPVRACAREKRVVVCPLCADFPCERLKILHKYPLFLADARRMQQVGLDAWVAEQEERAAAGFAYADVRFQ